MALDAANILIVEDEPAIAELVSFSLKTAKWNPIVASSATDAWNLMQWQVPDLVLLGWMLPGQSGMKLLQRIREDRNLKSLPVIMLTAKSTEEDKVEGLDQGVDDYLTKPFSPRELTARINALLRRKLPEHAKDVMRVASIELDPASRSVILGEQKIEISNMEYKLLKFFMAHPERVFSRSQLLDGVWGNFSEIDERTVDVHIRRLRMTLKKKGNHIRTVRGLGYMFSEKAT